ncbi:hypothetical protein BIV57_04555 [Mangrovactinospora gilvigrisea]|uniref:Uncharacterized protein n=1 Tax=Mangrovactinospora gilvigrisea TaxID=1428644 RepID=A0A1J7CAW9_9ACTN|nr:hypothetical protein [Mangrovactinospora gilvigrisea]OIV38664.1 hypothetical protein BIV57_04555 [Mangrovactinospora gilvigrisea]
MFTTSDPAALGELAGRLGQLAGSVGARGGTLLHEVRVTPWAGPAAQSFRTRLTVECTGIEEAARHLRGASSAMNDLAAAVARKVAAS